VGTDDHVCPPIEEACDKFRETLPVTAWKLLEGHNWYDRIRVGCHKADERFRVELLKKVRRDHWINRESSHRGNPLQYPGGKSVKVKVVRSDRNTHGEINELKIRVSKWQSRQNIVTNLVNTIHSVTTE
jgi:hypothetical protein